jgi:hypothetical protein
MSALDAPAGFEDADDPAAQGLRDTFVSPAVGHMYPEEFRTGWRVLERDDSTIIAAVGNPPVGSVKLLRRGDVWVWGGGGVVGEPCDLSYAPAPGAGGVAWALDASYGELESTDTVVHVLVLGPDCSDGEPLGDRLIGPQFLIDDHEMGLVFGVSPGTSSGPRLCPANAPDAVTVTLPEPLGDRDVVNALDLPPRQPVEMAQPNGPISR